HPAARLSGRGCCRVWRPPRFSQRNPTMKKTVLATVAAAAMMLAAGVATAAEVKGAITAVNGRVVTINGVNYTFPANVDMAGLAAGQTVTVTFATEGNVNTVSKVAK